MRIFSKNNILYVDFSSDGKRIRRSLRLLDNPQNRYLAINEIVPKLLKLKQDGGLKYIPTLNEYKSKSFNLQSSNRSSVTQKDYMNMYKRNIENTELGNSKIDKIKGTNITHFQNTLIKSGYSVSTIRTYKTLLSSIFEDAIKDEIILKNPCKLAAKLSTRGVEKKVIIPFTQSEIIHILDNSEGIYKNLFAVLFYTGFRGGEVLGLKWSDINFEQRKIQLNRQIRRSQVVPPKWDSYRFVPIIKVLLPYLENQKTKTYKYDNYVFLNTRNKPFSDISKIANKWKNTLNRTKIPYRSIHTTRHTFISQLISSGEKILTVSKIAGHSNISTTLKTYSHYIPQNLENFGSVFNNNVA